MGVQVPPPTRSSCTPPKVDVSRTSSRPSDAPVADIEAEGLVQRRSLSRVDVPK